MYPTFPWRVRKFGKIRNLGNLGNIEQDEVFKFSEFFVLHSKWGVFTKIRKSLKARKHRTKWNAVRAFRAFPTFRSKSLFYTIENKVCLRKLGKLGQHFILSEVSEFFYLSEVSEFSDLSEVSKFSDPFEFSFYSIVNGVSNQGYHRQNPRNWCMAFS